VAHDVAQTSRHDIASCRTGCGPGHGLSIGWTPSAISAEVGTPRATVYRIKENPAKAVALLETWGIA
jgi:hypothetical protein